MILVIFGQPHSGKSTLANELVSRNIFGFNHNIDGDKLREIFVNKDYSREGRMKNLNRSSEIATYLSYMGENVVISLVYPYKEARDYLRILSSDKAFWVYLTYDGERGREMYHAKDFEIPEDEDILHLNTSQFNLEECLNLIQAYIIEK